MSSPTHRIASPATNRLGSPSARIGSPRAEHSRLTASSQRPGSLLLPSSGTPGISLTSLASDNIVASVESLNEEENNRPPPIMSSTSQAAWKSLASTSLVLEPPSKPKKSALLSRIFSKPPTPKASEASKTATEAESIEGEPEEQDGKQATTNDEEEEAGGKVLPKRAHKLLPQRTQAVLDQTVDPNNCDGIDDAKTAEVTNVHMTAKARKREAVDNKAALAGEKEKAKKGKKRKEVEKKKKVEEEEIDEARIQKELKKRRKAAGSRRSSADFVKPTRSQSRQSSTSESSVSASSTTNLSTVSSQRVSASSTTNLSTASSMTNVSSQQATTSTKGRRAKVTLPNIVCTSCHRDDSAMVKDLVRKFGQFTFSSSVTASTTHVISGEGKRTLNLLKGLMQGCWLLTKEWAYSSLEEGRWAPEEPFEMVNFSPAVRNMREERINSGGAFKSELFKDVGTVFVSGECRAPKEELRQLILSGGGSVANTARVASVVVGEFRDPGENQSTDCVTEKWVLDSVQFHVVMPFSDYPL